MSENLKGEKWRQGGKAVHHDPRAELVIVAFGILEQDGVLVSSSQIDEFSFEMR